jgi:hypothetical protein
VQTDEIEEQEQGFQFGADLQDDAISAFMADGVVANQWGSFSPGVFSLPGSVPKPPVPPKAPLPPKPLPLGQASGTPQSPQTPLASPGAPAASGASPPVGAPTPGKPDPTSSVDAGAKGRGRGTGSKKVPTPVTAEVLAKKRAQQLHRRLGEAVMEAAVHCASCWIYLPMVCVWSMPPLSANVGLQWASQCVWGG